MAGLADLFAPEDYDPKKPEKPRQQHVPVKPKGELKKLDAGYYRDMPVMDKVSNVARTLGQAVGYSPTLANRMGEEAKTGIGFVPGVGDALGAVEAKESLLAGDIGKGLLQAGLTAVGVVPGVGDVAAKAGREGLETVADTMAAATRPSIKAYHGSPHSFDKFDMSKIGTGEGAQAYGHGLYFAENEKVAKEYRDTLAGGKTKWLEGDRELSGAEQNAAELLDRWKDKGKALAEIKYSLRPMRSADQKYLDETEAALQRLDPASIRVEQDPGSMYEVNIDADPEHFLDWDKPLSQQPQSVRDLLAKRDPDMYSPEGGDYDAMEPGQSIYTRMGSDPHPWFQGSNDQSKASEALKQAGIPGIKYLDAGSRVSPLELDGARSDLKHWDKMIADYGYQGSWTPEGHAFARQKVADLEAKAATNSRNYVVFDADKIEIVRRYGIPAALGAGLITEEMARQMQEQGIGET